VFRVKTNIRLHVGDVEAAAVPCGFGRAIGNKVGYVFSAAMLCKLVWLTFLCFYILVYFNSRYVRI
jgi:hypothetical protein